MDSHDIAGLIILHEPNHGEFLCKIDPSYSCISFDTNGLRINTKPFNTPEEKNKAVANSCNMTSTLLEVGLNQLSMLKSVNGLLEEKFDAVHTKGKFTDRRSTDN